MKVFVNGTILTMNPAQPRAEAIAICNDKILAVGTEAKVRKAVTKPEVIDLQGRCLLPGFHDSHVHLTYHGFEIGQLDLSVVQTLDEALHLIAQRAASTPKGNWITGAGFLMARWGVNHLDKSLLDKVVPHHPVFLKSQDHHSGWANSLTLQKAGITASTPQPEHGEIVKDAKGEPIGIFLEQASDLISKALPSKTREDIQQAVLAAGKDFATLGITTVHDMAVQKPHEWREMASLASRPDYPVRVWACIDQDNIEHLSALGLATGQGGENFQIGGVKFFADGALGSMTALMLEPYKGTTTYGFLVHSRELMMERFPMAIQAGLVPVIHAIGDAANRIVLDCLEATKHLWQSQNMRPRIEHAQHLHPDDLPRFAKLGIISSMQPIHYRFDAKRTTELLPDRLNGAHAWRGLKDSGAVIPLGSDTPVATPDVMLGLETACTRKAESIEFGHDQILTMDEALAGYTRDGAYTIHWEHRSGQLKVGFDADMVILSHDPHEGLESLSVQATMKAGNWTFQR
jgi:hypothetical protein